MGLRCFAPLSSDSTSDTEIDDVAARGRHGDHLHLRVHTEEINCLIINYVFAKRRSACVS